jgi:hypothetical protein
MLNNYSFDIPEKLELNLDNPVFVFYLDVSNKSRQSAAEYIENTRKHFDIYKNATLWFVASNKDEVVCVYDGWGRNRDLELKDLIEEINNKIEILSQSHSFEDFKIKVRDWRMEKLLNEKQEN